MAKIDSNKTAGKAAASSKKSAKKKVSKKKVSKKAVKKTTARKTSAKTSAKKVSTSRKARPSISDDERRMMIAVHAYYKWEKAGFPTGQDNHHWLEAEKEVEDMLK